MYYRKYIITLMLLCNSFGLAQDQNNNDLERIKEQIRVIMAPEKNNSHITPRDFLPFPILHPNKKNSLLSPTEAIYEKFPQEFPESFRVTLAFLENPRLFQVAGAEIPNKFLFYGAPGCGKSYLAELIAQEFELPMIYAKASDFEDKFYGESSKKITAAFNYRDPQGQPLLLFIDEIDAIAKQRRETTSEASRSTINTLLVELQKHSADSSIIIIFATNDKESLDKAILDRFDGLCIEIEPMQYEEVKSFVNDFLEKIQAEDKNYLLKVVSKKAKNLSRRVLSASLKSAYAWYIYQRHQNPQFVMTANDVLKFINHANKDNKTSWKNSIRSFINETSLYVNYSHALIGTFLTTMQILHHPAITPYLTLLKK